MKFTNLIFTKIIDHLFLLEKFWQKWDLHILIQLSLFLCILFQKDFKESVVSEADILKLITLICLRMIWFISLNPLSYVLIQLVKLHVSLWSTHQQQEEKAVNAWQFTTKNIMKFSMEWEKELDYLLQHLILWLTPNVQILKARCMLFQKSFSAKRPWEKLKRNKYQLTLCTVWIWLNKQESWLFLEVVLDKEMELITTEWPI